MPKWTVRYATEFFQTVEAASAQEAIAKAESFSDEDWQTSGDSPIEAEEED